MCGSRQTEKLQRSSSPLSPSSDGCSIQQSEPYRHTIKEGGVNTRFWRSLRSQRSADSGQSTPPSAGSQMRSVPEVADHFHNAETKSSRLKRWNCGNRQPQDLVPVTTPGGDDSMWIWTKERKQRPLVGNVRVHGYLSQDSCDRDFANNLRGGGPLPRPLPMAPSNLSRDQRLASTSAEPPLNQSPTNKAPVAHSNALCARSLHSTEGNPQSPFDQDCPESNNEYIDDDALFCSMCGTPRPSNSSEARSNQQTGGA